MESWHPPPPALFRIARLHVVVCYKAKYSSLWRTLVTFSHGKWRWNLQRWLVGTWKKCRQFYALAPGSNPRGSQCQVVVGRTRWVGRQWWQWRGCWNELTLTGCSGFFQAFRSNVVFTGKEKGRSFCIFVIFCIIWFCCKNGGERISSKIASS